MSAYLDLEDLVRRNAATFDILDGLSIVRGLIACLCSSKRKVSIERKMR